MPALATDLRNKLERAIIEARDVAEVGARAALEALAVHHHEPYPHQKPDLRQLRVQLRARARQLGDMQNSKGELGLGHLIHECAYEHWHRMLFARFLAENDLLIEPESGVAITLNEAKQLAKKTDTDLWTYASRCAQRMLPQIFRPDDPLLQVTFAREYQVKLERLLANLDPAIFRGSDALGWVYQFWQSKKKDQVNASEVKIGADEISAVTQLFTEPYMVEFLLHNTLGAWWAGKSQATKEIESTKTEGELRKKVALPGVTWDYLRFVRDANSADGPWRPAAGTFEGWPKSAAELRILDPFCGSGHFLVAALHHLVPVRMAEEGLSVAKAVDAVLRDNLHGLEIDERCCQIAAFALAFAAWTYPKAEGYRSLPELNIACTGIGPQSTQEQWIDLAEQSGIPMPTVGHEAIKNGLLNLHRLFSQAPILGSLINPTELPADLIAADFETIQPYLITIRDVEKSDDETRERAIAAAGMVKAADLLAGEYTLVITNVPYLKREKFQERIRDHCDRAFPRSKSDLATVCIERCADFCAKGATYASVAPQSWLYLQAFADMRTWFLKHHAGCAIAKLGPGAFETIGGEVVNVVLSVFTVAPPPSEKIVFFFDVTDSPGPQEKADALRNCSSEAIMQAQLRKNPDARIVIANRHGLPLLSDYANALEGLSTGDLNWTTRRFWELPEVGDEWVWFQGTVKTTCLYGGRETILLWCDGGGPLSEIPGARVIGRTAWGHGGVAMSQMHRLGATLFSGDKYDDGTAAMIPKSASHLPALWAYCSSEDFREKVREIDESLKVTSKSLIKVPFDIAHWQKIAAKTYPDGLPEPESDDPTQWLFHGHPNESEKDMKLHVALARLLGYRWPAELDEKMRLSNRARALTKKCAELAKFADDDGIVCIPAIRGEEPAADRLLRLLDACDINPRITLADGDVDNWLRNDFFEEHCKLFLDRPFVWHIWDGRKRDGFHALVNYHKLAESGGKGRKLLESLTYSYLGDWISRQQAGVRDGEDGAEDRLAAATELQKRLVAILAGEPPFDLFVRWKPLTAQPVGWEPDINDGVRVNIRPFLAEDLPNGRVGAGVLRWRANVKWEKDRGKELPRKKAEYPWLWGWDGNTLDFMGGEEFTGARFNACHYTNRAKNGGR